MAEEISKPLCKANKVTMVSSGGGEVGAAKLSGEVLDIMTRLPETVEKLTGVTISQVTHSRFYSILYFTGHAVSHVKCIMEDARMYVKAAFIEFLPTGDRRTEKHTDTHTVLAFYHLIKFMWIMCQQTVAYL